MHPQLWLFSVSDAFYPKTGNNATKLETLWLKNGVEVNVAATLVVLLCSALFASWCSPGCKPATKLPGVEFQCGAWSESGGGVGVKARLHE